MPDCDVHINTAHFIIRHLMDLPHFDFRLCVGYTTSLIHFRMHTTHVFLTCVWHPSPAPFSAVDIAIDVGGDYHVPTASFSGKQTPEPNKQETGCASRLL